jgi:lipopolysaccharide transport system ATP-binding protein
MSNTVISVENLSKSYRLGQIGTGTFSRDLELWWAKLRGKPNPHLRIGETDHGNRHGEELWALKDVSFTVEQGEVLGIIGRNGAGKSTLLKILSRVTAPTSGKIKVKGRVASLLEVGTGFHPELTGHENIYLNGAILGMSQKEIDRRFDEIVDFAEVEKFIETPVKRYSSGMYVRLAFAVAAHLDPEILVVDEVLAVGDAAFQKKCLGKMGDVAKGGRTVLFVSHNMASVRLLCNNGILLSNGDLTFCGSIAATINQYSKVFSEIETNASNEPITFTDLKISCLGNNYVAPQKPFKISGDINIKTKLSGFKLFCIIQNGDGQVIIHSEEKNQINLPELCEPGDYRLSINFPALWLKPGVYSLYLKLITEFGKKGYSRFLSNNVILDVNEQVTSEMLYGLLTPVLNWEIFPLKDSNTIHK